MLVLHRSYGIVLWELLTCETPYKDVDSSAIIWGVGSNSLHLPIPSTCPDGFQLLMKMCWSNTPSSRPSFKQIQAHLAIASQEVLRIQPEDYYKKQVIYIMYKIASSSHLTALASYMFFFSSFFNMYKIMYIYTLPIHWVVFTTPISHYIKTSVHMINLTLPKIFSMS